MLNLLLNTLLDLLRPSRSLALENLALRQQLLVLERKNPKPTFTTADRLFWVILSRIWPGWHRALWRAWWRRKSRPREPGRPTQTWKTFLRNHLDETAAIDFLAVPTIWFRTLYVFVVLSLDRRRIIHVNVTTRPTARWTAMQLYQAFPFDEAPRFLIRDRDGVYGDEVKLALERMGKDAPDGREVEPLEAGPARRRPMVGGLHSRYYREAA